MVASSMHRGRDNMTRHVVWRMSGRLLRLTSVAVALAVLAVACGGGVLSSSDLPRTTKQNITITMTESVETLQLPGCHTYWLSRGEEPPPGACERAATVREFTARHDTAEVTTSVTGGVVRDPWFALRVVSRNRTEGISVMVILPPSEAAIVQLTDSTGLVVDRVEPSDRLVALAGFGSDLTVEALAVDGLVIAACPPDGVVIDGIGYTCTPASGAAIPVTTTTLENGLSP